MSFSISGSGHCDTQEDFEAVVEKAKAATAAIGEHTNAPFYLSLTGTDGNGQPVSLGFSSDGTVTDHNAPSDTDDASTPTGSSEGVNGEHGTT